MQIFSKPYSCLLKKVNVSILHDLFLFCDFFFSLTACIFFFVLNMFILSIDVFIVTADVCNFICILSGKDLCKLLKLVSNPFVNIVNNKICSNQIGQYLFHYILNSTCCIFNLTSSRLFLINIR